MSAQLPVFIAADVGGTHARIGLVRAGSEGGIELLHCERYRCAAWPGLTEILADFVARFGSQGGSAVRHAVLACAGYVQDDAVINVNLPWLLPLAPLRERLGLSAVEIINDFEAVAHAVPTLEPEALRTIVAGHGAAASEGPIVANQKATPIVANQKPTPIGGPIVANQEATPIGGPIVVMGPGTGLGCAFVLPGTDRDLRLRVLPTEAGHMGLALATPREAAVLRQAAREADFTEVEHALCGPGLLRLYRAIAALASAEAPLATPAEVANAAVGGSCPMAVEALGMFCALLGAVAADLATVARASGGVVLAGGILPQIEGFLKTSGFAARFLRGGVMKPFLEQVPVRLIDHGELGLIGAAQWSLGWGVASQATDATR